MIQMITITGKMTLIFPLRQIKKTFEFCHLGSHCRIIMIASIRCDSSVPITEKA